MTQQYDFQPFFEMNPPDVKSAQKAHGRQHAALSKQLTSLSRKCLWARQNSPILEYEKLDQQFQELKREFTIFNDTYNHMRHEAAERALAVSSDTLRKLRENVEALDRELLDCLNDAYQVLQDRMTAEVEYNEMRSLLSNFSKKYPELGYSVAPGRGLSTSWGDPLPVAKHEQLPAAFKLYAARFAGKPTTDLHSFNRGG